MLMLTQLCGFGAGQPSAAVTPVDLTYIAMGVSASDLTTYTFSAQIPSRAYEWIAVVTSVGISGSNGRVISTMTMAGVSGAAQVNSTFSGSGSSAAGIYTAVIPASTSGNIVITFSGSMARAMFGLYEMRFASGVTAHATNSSIADVGQVMSGTLNIPANGAAVGLAYNNNSSATSWTWSNLTENFDTTIEAGERTVSGAAAEFATQQTGLTISATSSTALTFENFVIASWGP